MEIELPKPITLSNECERFLIYFRKNYDKIKLKPDFDSYCVKYYQIMKTARYPADIYIDIIILKKELTEIKKKQQNYKTAITETYSSIKINLSTFFECSKKDYKAHFKSTMDSLNVTTNTILKMTNDTTRSKINKQCSLFDEELKLIFKSNLQLMNKRFDDFRKSLNTSTNKKGDDLTSTSQRDSTLNGSNVSLNTEKSLETPGKSNIDIFKKPFHPPSKGKINNKINDLNSIESKCESIKNISNHNFNVSNILPLDNEKVVHLDVTQNEDSFMKHVANHSTKIPHQINYSPTSNVIKQSTCTNVCNDEKVMNLNVTQNEDSFMKHVSTHSTKIVCKRDFQLEAEVFQHKPIENTTVNSIVLESSSDNSLLLKKDNKSSIKVSIDKEMDGSIDKNTNSLSNDFNIKANINKILELEQDWVIPSDNTFKGNILVQSTKIPHSSNKVLLVAKKTLNDDVNKESFMEHIVYQSTKILKNVTDFKQLNKKSPENSAVETDSVIINDHSKELNEDSDIEILTGSFKDKLSCNLTRGANQKINSNVNESAIGEGKFFMNMPLAQSTYLPCRNIAMMSKIEERSETSSSKCDGSTNGALSTSNFEKEAYCNKTESPKQSSIQTFEKNNNRASEDLLDKSSNNAKTIVCDKENLNISLSASYQLDTVMEELKNYFRTEFVKLNQTLTSPKIEISSNLILINKYDKIINNPWNEKAKENEWKVALQKLLNLRSVIRSDDNQFPRFIFHMANCNREFILERKLESKGENDLFVVKTEGYSKKFIVKMKVSDQCLEYYYLKGIHSDQLKSASLINIVPSICEVIGLHISPDRSSFLMPFYSKGDLFRLQSLLHNHSLSYTQIELISSYIAMELIATIYRLHVTTKMLHCNIKPINILLNESFPIFKSTEIVRLLKTGVIVLINFDKAIYFNKYPSNCGFMVNNKDISNYCVEMKAKMPWSYQLDLFNVATSLYLLLQNNFPRIIQFKGRMVFENLNNFNSLRAGNVWLNLFNFLLNFDVKQYHNILGFLDIFQKLITDNMSDYNRAAYMMNKMLEKVEGAS